MKKIKLFIKSILLFIPFSVLLYIVFIIIWSGLPFQFLKPNINYRIGSYGHMYSRINEVENYKNVDVLFLGSSHSYRGFDIRIFSEYGLKTFNLGSSGQTPIQTDVLLQRYLTALNPKMVIFEVSPMVFSSDGIEASLDLFANDKKDLLTLTKLIKWNNIKAVNTAIVGFFRNLMHLDSDFVEKNKKDKDLYISGGFVERELTPYKQTSIVNKDIYLDDNQIAAFQSCVNRIKSNNIKLILVQAPITSSLYNSYSNAQNFDKLMLKYGKYYNFNDFCNLEDSVNFYDPDHLNQIGVTTFNNKLISLLKLN